MRKLTLEEVELIAAKYNGRCLSKRYTVQKKLLWECNAGHRWQAKPYHIKAGSWCPKCAGNLKLTIYEIKLIGKERRWNLLSKSYVNAGDPLKWQCSLGHVFYKSWNKVQQGRGCPRCNSFTGEEICRLYFEIIFKKPFPKKKPTWLINKSGARMELDGICEELKIAFEHQGEQHYKAIGLYPDEQVKIIQLRDRLKRKLCKTHGIKLIEVPDVLNITGISNLLDVITEQCKKQNIKLPRNTHQLKFPLDLPLTNRANFQFERLSLAASNVRGVLLSKSYTNAYRYYKFRCTHGHLFSATATAVLNGDSWCPFCRSRRKASQVTMNDRIRGLGVCCTKQIKDVRQNVKFCCTAKGHIFWDTYDNVSIRVRQKMIFCPICRKQEKY